MPAIKKNLLLLCAIIATTSFSAQPLNKKQVFTHADTLRGSIGPGRDWWDVTHYDIHAAFNFADSTISGNCTISFRALRAKSLMQIDLQEPLVIDSCILLYGENKRGANLAFRREGNAWFITNIPPLATGTINELNVFYHGKPAVAKHAPWDGGLVWKKDKNNNPWMSIACQGTGASVWYPCKDHQSDEADSAALHITCPANLIAVGNGRLRNTVKNTDGTATYTWAVREPINNYCIIPSIGNYRNFSEKYAGEKGTLDMDYWVLEENLEAAKKQFADAPRMMKAFEYWFGPYPFYEDSYKLVDAPFLGMEHQSAIAYGNGYVNGYHGMDLSGSGWGMKWDFIIVHESGHEWFANNITTKDIADMWVHEGFTNYSETLFTDYYYGKEAGNAYCQGLRKNINNDIPIIGAYGVNKEGSGDMYPKAANMIHSIRQIMNDDEKFRQMLRGMNQTFYHKTVSTQEIENYIGNAVGKDLSKIFDQYLRTVQVPKLKYKVQKGVLTYQWSNCVKGFDMPLRVFTGSEYVFIDPTEKMKKI
ncbi:MAG: M1 family metallopeptidase, partial [Bacteroidia bacterium]